MSEGSEGDRLTTVVTHLAYDQGWQYDELVDNGAIGQAYADRSVIWGYCPPGAMRWEPIEVDDADWLREYPPGVRMARYIIVERLAYASVGWDWIIFAGICAAGHLHYALARKVPVRL